MDLNHAIGTVTNSPTKIEISPRFVVRRTHFIEYNMMKMCQLESNFGHQNGVSQIKKLINKKGG
jgi:hypothetical protein